MNTTGYRGYVSKYVICFLKNNIVFRGIVKDVTEFHILIEDVKIGLTTISISEIIRIELRGGF